LKNIPQITLSLTTRYLEQGIYLPGISVRMGYSGTKAKGIFKHVLQRNYIKFKNPINDIDLDGSFNNRRNPELSNFNNP
jgi:hypothetical protein